MTLKSVIDIDINDENFTRFKRLFDKYQEQLAKAPGLWKAATKEQYEQTKNFERMAAAMLSVSHMNREVVDSNDEYVSQLSRAEGLWSSIARHSAAMLSSVVHAGEKFLKWSGIFGELLGLGGLFGLDRLAGGAGAGRRAALGLGTSYGEARAFDIDFSRLVDTQGLLGFVNQMETDVTQQGPAYALTGRGLTGNSAQDALGILEAARGLAKRTPTNLLGPMFSAYGLQFSADEMRRLKGSDQEFGELKTKYGKDAESLNIKDKILKDWQDLDQQLERAWAAIQKTLVETLVPLAGPLEQLSDKFVQLVADFAKSDMVGNSIAKLGEWIQEFAGWLGTLDRMMPVYLKELDDLFGKVHAFTHPGEAFQGWVGGQVDQFQKDTVRFWANFQASARGVPKSLVDAIISNESGFNPQLIGSHGEQGAMQLMPEMLKAYHVRDPFSAIENTSAGIEFIKHLQEKYGANNFAEIMAAYNMGETKFDKLIKKFGAGWESAPPPSNGDVGLPSSTAEYVAKGLAKIDIHLINSTGSSITHAAEQLAAAGKLSTVAE